MDLRPSDRQRFQEAGVQVYTLSPDEESRWYKIFDTVTEKWIAESEAQGYPAKDAINVMNRVIRTLWKNDPDQTFLTLPVRL